MKLFVYDHCPYCVRARMIFNLKNIPVDLVMLLNDDEDTPIRMVGKKMVPILQKDNGDYMPESLDIVNYVDQNYGGTPILTDLRSDEIAAIISEIQSIDSSLVYPRYIELGLPEFSTQSAIDYFVNKKSEKVGSFSECRNKTNEFVKQLEVILAKLDNVLKSTDACNGKLSIDDICLFSLLRNLTCVKSLQFPPKVKAYIESMAKQSKIDLYLEKAI